MQFSDISKQVTTVVIVIMVMIMMNMAGGDSSITLDNLLVIQVAEDWRNCAESVKRTYEEKAQRFVPKI